MSLETLAITDQEVTQQTPVKVPPGFYPGNTYHLLSDKGRGRAKFGTRLSHILESKTKKEIEEIAQDENQLGIEALAHTRAAAAINGDRQDAEFVVEHLEGKIANKQELTGKDGGPVAVVTADVGNLLLELSQKAME